MQLPPGVAPFDSGKLGGGKTWSHTFTAPGRYQYVCLPHEEHGMIGVVNVTARALITPHGGSEDQVRRAVSIATATATPITTTSASVRPMPAQCSALERPPARQ